MKFRFPLGQDSYSHPACLKSIDWNKLALCSTAEARKLLDYHQASKLSVLPLYLLEAKNQRVLHCASKDDKDINLINELRFATEQEVKLIKVDPACLPRAIFSAYHQDSDSLIAKHSSSLQHVDKEQRALSDLEADQTNPFLSPAGKLIKAVIDYSAARGVSDIHICPQAQGTKIKIRIDGKLYGHEGIICQTYSHNKIVNILKVLSKLDTTKSRQPQDGCFTYPFCDSELRIRISSLPTLYGENIVLRLLGLAEFYEISKVGFDLSTRGFLDSFLLRQQGMALFIGATGCGKSTSLYSIIGSLKKHNLSIVSIEDPIELEIPGITQCQVDHNQKLDYERCLKSALRQDPDAIFLGEIRDSTSVITAQQAALSGHMLLSSMHASNVFEALTRLIQLGSDWVTLSQSIKLLISQRLVPKLCDKCKIPDLDATRALGQSLSKISTIYRRVGCETCHKSGYAGRVLVCESLVVTEELAECLRTYGSNLTHLKKLTNTQNYVSMKVKLKELLLEGVIERDLGVGLE